MTTQLVDHITATPPEAVLGPASPAAGGASGAVKRLLDVTLALLGLLLLVPLLLLIAAAVHLEDRGPVLFRQARLGRDGQPFRVFKFRTMVTDAERRKADLLDDNESSGLLFKMKADPRITMVGRWLRRT